MSPVLLAYVQTAIGEQATALESLASGLEQCATEMVLLPVRRDVDALRELPGFQSILRRINLA